MNNYNTPKICLGIKRDGNQCWYKASMNNQYCKVHYNKSLDKSCIKVNFNKLKETEEVNDILDIVGDSCFAIIESYVKDLETTITKKLTCNGIVISTGNKCYNKRNSMNKYCGHHKRQDKYYRIDMFKSR